MGYVQSTSDPCIYTSSEGETSIIGVYVDDFVIAAESPEKIEEVKSALAQKFDVKDLDWETTLFSWSTSHSG